jgi:hypothetical protein
MKFTSSEPSNVYIFKKPIFQSTHPNWRQETFVRSGSAHIDAFLTRYVCLFVRLSVRSIDDTARTCFPRLSMTLDVRPASYIHKTTWNVRRLRAFRIHRKSKIHFFISFHPCDDDDGNAPSVDAFVRFARRYRRRSSSSSSIRPSERRRSSFVGLKTRLKIEKCHRRISVQTARLRGNNRSLVWIF